MKKFIAISVFATGIAMQCQAQSFLGTLKQKQQGEGTVTIKQSADIDNLVNNAKLKAGSTQAAQQTAPKQERQDVNDRKQTAAATATQHKAGKQGLHKHSAAEHKPAITEHKLSTPAEHKQSAIAEHKPAIVEHKQEQPAEKHTPKAADTADTTPVVDTSKKLMRNSYKVTGYRIQAYSGGNTKADREKANKIGNAIKMKYPNQPVYVHFYTPRWICRVGNFRSYAEAAQMLKGIKAMGYTQACIVKGKINVAY